MGERQMIRTQIVTASSAEPLDLEEAKIHLRLGVGQNEEEDDLIMGLIRSSREKAESITGLKIMPQTWYAYFDEFPVGDDLYLPLSPLRSVPSSGVYYTNSTDGSTTFASTKWDYDANSVPSRVVLGYNYDWPSNSLHTRNPIRIECVCGYAGTTSVPDSIKSAMKLMVGHWHENREDSITGVHAINSIPLGSRQLLDPYKSFYSGA